MPSDLHQETYRPGFPFWYFSTASLVSVAESCRIRPVIREVIRGRRSVGLSNPLIPCGFASVSAERLKIESKVAMLPQNAV